MTDNRIDEVIAALNSFEPSDDSVARLYEIFSGFESLPQRSCAMPAMFSLLERFPDADFGSPGPLVHELEAIPGDLYLPLLRDSLRRLPTFLTVWMVNRLLNARLPSDQRESWLTELRAVLEHPLASEQIRQDAGEFLARHEGKNRSAPP